MLKKIQKFLFYHLPQITFAGLIYYVSSLSVQPVIKPESVGEYNFALRKIMLLFEYGIWIRTWIITGLLCSRRCPWLHSLFRLSEITVLEPIDFLILLVVQQLLKQLGCFSYYFLIWFQNLLFLRFRKLWLHHHFHLFALKFLSRLFQTEMV